MSERLPPSIARYLYTRTAIVVRPEFVDLTGSLSAAVFLGQATYWQGISDAQCERGERADRAWFKSSAEWSDETRLTRREQEGARRRLRDLGILHETRRGEPPRLWFEIAWDALEAALRQAAAQARAVSVAEPVRGAPFAAWSAWAARGLPADTARWTAGDLAKYSTRLLNSLHGQATKTTHAAREIANDLIAAAGAETARRAVDHASENWSTFRREKGIDAQAPHLAVVRGCLDDLLNRAQGTGRRQRA